MKRRARRLALLTALGLTTACGARIGKGEYAWLGGEREYNSGSGALRVQWRHVLTGPKEGMLAPSTGSGYRPVENAVAAVDVENERVYVGADSGQLHAFGFDGRALYRFELHEAIECEPALDAAKNELYVGTERGELYAIAPKQGTIRWKVDTLGAIRRQPLLLNDAIYVITEDDVIEALSRADGSVLWSYKRERNEGFLVAGHSGMLLTEDHRIMAGFNDGMVVCLDALDGRVKWERDTSYEVPETEPGRPRYTDVDTTPTLIGEQLYVASFGAGLYALDANNGSVVWREAEWTGVTGLAATQDGALILISAERGVARYDVVMRGPTWVKTLERGSFGTPELFENLVVVGDSRGSLVALDQETGNELGRVDTGHGFSARAVMKAGLGFVVTNGGVLLGMRVAP